MRAPELLLLYGLVGLGASAAVLAEARASRAKRLLDALLVLGFWPLYGPFLLLRPAVAPAGEDRVHGVALRIAAAETRLAELDALLARPEHSAALALEREVALRDRGDPEGERIAHARVVAIARLAELRARIARELDLTRELVTQLELADALARLAGDGSADTRDLVAELSARVEGLDAVLGLELAGPQR